MGKLELCILCDFHSFEERLNVAGWVDCLGEFFFFHHAVPQCSMRLQVRTTSLQQQRSADRLPGIWLLYVYSWRRCFLLNHPQQVNKSSGQEHRWKYISEGRNWTHRQARCNPPRKLRCCLFSSPGFVARWAECGVPVCAPPPSPSPPNKTEWKSWSQRNESGCTVGVLSSLQTRKGRMQTRLKKNKRKTGWHHKAPTH